jgi:hypothetical protein
MALFLQIKVWSFSVLSIRKDSQWKVLCSATQVVDDLISRAKDRESVDWRYHRDVFILFKFILEQLIFFNKQSISNTETE